MVTDIAPPKLALLLASVILAAFSSIPPVRAQQPVAINKGIVELETAGSDGISVRIAEDLAHLIDDGATRRVIPLVGKGSLQNITDLKYLRGVDIAIVQADILEYAKEQRYYPGMEASLTYITKLFNEELHILARAEVKSLSDLAGQKVNFDLLNSGTAITTARVFDLLKLRVAPTYDAQQIALAKLRRGEIAALAFVAGKPTPLFTGLPEAEGLHFIMVPFTLSGNAPYSPTRLTSVDYPSLVAPNQPVDTIAVGSILLAADLRMVPERYNNVANFVEVFFNSFQSLLAPGNHPKWNEVNLAAELPGWRRYAPAEQWLQRNSQVAGIKDPDKLKAMFSSFIDERRQATGGAPMTEAEKNALFQQFQSWRGGSER